jgi:hypothetical protein
VLLEKDEPKTSTGPDPQALIEEARQLQRQRTRRRTVAVQVAGLLIVLGFGVNHFARWGSNTGPAPLRPVAASSQVPTVIYTKSIVQRFVPRLPIETQTVETWSPSNAPWIARTIVTIARGPRVEVGSGSKHDKLLGLEQANYLYDPSTQTIWRISSLPLKQANYLYDPAAKAIWRMSCGPIPSLERLFKQVLAQSGNHLAGTRMYLGRSVYVVKLRTPTGEGTYYIDKRTFVPLMNDLNGGYGLRTVYRTVVYKTLPATKANLALTSPPTAHPRAKIVLHATPHMQDLFSQVSD